MPIRQNPRENGLHQPRRLREKREQEEAKKEELTLVLAQNKKKVNLWFGHTNFLHKKCFYANTQNK